MKHAVRRICILIFLVLCAAVFQFFHLFMVTDKSMQFVDWQSAVQILEDGSQVPFDQLNAYSNTDTPSGTYRFTAELTPTADAGYLLFELSGEELTLSLNGEELYHSSATCLKGVVNTAQAHIPLPAGSQGQLVMDCTVLDHTNAIFPPLLRFIPDGTEDTQHYLYASFYGIPAGVSALTLLLAAGLFLLSIIRRETDFSLIPLTLAAAALTVFPISKGLGYYFMPEHAVSILSWQGFNWIAPAALILYLAMNRKRNFWKLLGYATFWSGALLLVCCLISCLNDGDLAKYLYSELNALLQGGYYQGLLTWLTRWLSVVCAFLSAYMVMRSFADQQARAKALALRNELLLNSYRTLEKSSRDGAALRHAFRHQLIAIDSLYHQKNFRELEQLLEKLKKQEEALPQTRFTANFTLNAILQETAAGAARQQIDFEARVHAPENLSIPENDLCLLLMNMTENALEAASQVTEPRKRFVRFQAEVKGGVLAVRCENSHSETLRKDGRGHLRTTKKDPGSHGFGIPQMTAVAKKYGGNLEILFPEKSVFVVQVTLNLPQPPDAS